MPFLSSRIGVCAAFCLLAVVSTTSRVASAEKYQWKSADSPAPRLAGTLSFDATRERLVMFGGKSVSGVLNDTWEWDGITWAPRAVALPPAGRFGALSFFDAIAGRVVMHGGATSSTTYNDSWEWNGSSWRIVPPIGAAPSLRAFSAGALDTKRNVFVLFGGLDPNGSALSDTWEFSVATRTWAKRTSATTPVGRQFSAMAYDSDREKMVMTGGLNFAAETQLLDDTWEWDGTDWTRPPYTGLPLLELHTMTYDKKRSRMVLFIPYASYFAGTDNVTAELEGNAWVSKLTGGIATSAQFPTSTYDPVNERAVMYSPDAFGSALWEWSGSAWTRRGPGAGPGGRGYPCTASDTDRKRFIYFGGTVGAGLNDLWEFDGGAWANKTPAGVKPASRYQCTMAYDSIRKKTVLFGGEVPGVGQGNDTWLWDGQNWSEKLPATTPPWSYPRIR